MEAHEYANLFPMLPDAELQELAADIKSHGLQTRITTYQGKILDGCNRWRACEIAGVTPSTIEFTGADPLAFVVSGNLIRRHLSESQRGKVAAKLSNLNNGQRPPSIGGGAVTQGAAAKMLNVGESSITRARSVITKGTPELNAAVQSGERTDLPQICGRLQTEPEAQFLTPETLCRRWQISTATLRRWRNAGKIKAHHIGRGIRFSLEEIQKFEAAAQS